MSDLKTIPSERSISEYLADLADERVREDSENLCRLMQEVTGEPPVLWGSGVIGFGSYHYRYASGREGDWFRVGFASRPRKFTLYFQDGFSERGELLEKLGPHSTAISCLYIKRLSDVDQDVLRDLVAAAWQTSKDQWG